MCGCYMSKYNITPIAVSICLFVMTLPLLLLCVTHNLGLSGTSAWGKCPYSSLSSSYSVQGSVSTPCKGFTTALFSFCCQYLAFLFPMEFVIAAVKVGVFSSVLFWREMHQVSCPVPCVTWRIVSVFLHAAR